MFYFESQETNRTKILRKLRFARLQIRVEGVKGEEGTLKYPLAFFLPLVFENSNQSIIEYSTVTWIWPLCTFTDRISQTREDDTFWCMQWYQEYKNRLLLRCIHHFISELIYNMDHMRISGTGPSSVILNQTK